MSRAPSLQFFRKRRPPPGAHPGEIAHEPAAGPTRWRALHYDADGVDEIDEPTVEGLAALRERPGVLWIDVQGLGDGALVQQLGDALSLHPLAVADVFHPPQRPKTEPYPDFVFVVARTPLIRNDAPLRLEQLSLFYGKGWALTIQQEPGELLDSVRSHILGNRGVIRSEGADYLAYAVVDAAIDAYFPLLDALGDDLAELEDEALERPTKSVIRRNNRVRSSLLALHRVLLPQKEALHGLCRLEAPLVSDTVRLYLRDTADHCQQVADVIDSYREVVIGIAGTWASSVDNYANEVMRALTVVASLFIPLNFVAALYGMNFKYMPELDLPYGYPAVLAAMACVAAGMLIYFYRKGWLRRPEDEDE
ncbi:MAG: magnesium/cobalt transporter CorA [Acidobacteria bacterium]|nr:magnesium/cobalt transporter CorA [Acidobacteriota bacterium]